jgi:beta-ureidopropionase / N-carbamoyl-L-amino-acid hydrolase
MGKLRHIEGCSGIIVPMDSPSVIANAVASQQTIVTSLFNELRKNTTEGRGIRRDAYGKGENYAHELVAATGRSIGLEVACDSARNTYMTLKGREPSAPRIILGSHLDSVPDGGNFDGAAGVVAGLATLATLKSSGVQPRSDVTAMAVRAEESVWFSTSLFGSRAAMGDVPAGILDTLKRADTGRCLADHIRESGGNVDDLRAGKAYLQPKAMKAYLEIHIEQGPVLEAEGLPIGVVSGVRGNSRRAAAKVLGEYNHCGGVPQEYRRDAVVAASELVHLLDETWREWTRKHKDMAFTVGKMFTNPDRHALVNIPGEVTFSLDIRSVEQKYLTELEGLLEGLCARISREKGVRFELGPAVRSPVGVVEPSILNQLVVGAEALNIPYRVMPSGASHDAAAFARAGVPMGMIFVRNKNGSHNPDESMEIGDLMEAIKLMTWWVVGNSKE